MKCIKTGFMLYVESQGQYTRADLFFDGQNLYANQNTFLDGTPEISQIEISCSSIERSSDQLIFKLNNPKINPSVIKYVENMIFKGIYEEHFIRWAKNGILL